MKRCFELRHSGHDKFWVVQVVGCHYLATFGKIGTKGQTQVKSFPTPSGAAGEASKMIREKTRKGYSQVGEDAYAGASPSMLASLGAGDYDLPALPAAPAPAIAEDAPARRIRRDL